MICTECGEKTNVIDSRWENPYVRRRRMCPKCSKRVTTVEVIVQREFNEANARPSECVLVNRDTLQRLIHTASQEAAQRLIESLAEISNTVTKI